MPLLPFNPPPHRAANPAAGDRHWLRPWLLWTVGGLCAGVVLATLTPAFVSDAHDAPTPLPPPATALPPFAVADLPPPAVERWNIGASTVTVIAFPQALPWPSRIVRRVDRAAFLRQPAAALVNGGYFEPSGKPSGMLVEGDQILAPDSHGGLMSGFVWADIGGQVHIAMDRTPPALPVRWAIQTGPVLVEPGGKMGIRGPGTASARTVLAIRDHRLWLVSSDAVSLFDLAQALIDRGVDRAINLDGGPSRTLDLQLPGGQTHLAGDPAVPYYLGFAPDGSAAE